ncbi:Scr1 family TA system antitoxin-like transcriptional regulator [Streptomyces sp. NRRL F-2580]|uniref:Scr1 family TA system antitoxin-like transcriptional regulator n=1 Tax=Streptomyces sp. NRRL F-2580 TaxID=1463841 RepID=UPI002D21858C|nr:Scr1 family TA system antitoxin-like transcriptional regulator [Streptomyces sp. NRRL F-2580]
MGPYAVGAHPGLSGQFSILRSADNPEAGAVYLERFTSELYMEKPSDVQGYGRMYDRLQAQVLDPDRTRRFITDVIRSHIDAGGS